MGQANILALQHKPMTELFAWENRGYALMFYISKDLFVVKLRLILLQADAAP
jgi:hypothetical protein